MSTLVFVENHGGELQKGSLGVLAKAASLGDGEVAAVIAGEGAKALAAEAGKFGAAKVWVCDDAEVAQPLPQPRVDVLAQVVEERRLRHRALRQLRPRRRRRRRSRRAPRRGAQLGSRRPRARGRRAVGKRPALQDSVYVDVGWTSTPRLALFRAGSFDATATGGGGEPEIVDVSPSYAAHSTAVKLVGQDSEESSGPSIEDADVIVAGGRGLGSPENFTLAEELAQALGGAVGATRAVVDAGWYPYSAQIGQTGKTVSPKLYVALGISGAIQHKVGMQSSGTIVAINKDANAPIFEFSDLGVVGDVARDRPEAHRAAQRPQREPPEQLPAAVLGTRLRRRADRSGRRADRGRRPHRRRGPGRPRVRDPARPAARRAPGTGRAARARCRSRCSRRASSRARISSPARSSTPGRCAGSSRDRLRMDELPSYGEVPGEAVYLLTRAVALCRSRRRRRCGTTATGSSRSPQLGRFLAEKAEEGGAMILPETAAQKLLVSHGRVVGVRTGDKGRGREGGELANFEAGSDLVAKVTVLAEGTQGHLTGVAIDRFDLRGEEPQVWELGVKEVWKVAKPLDRVIHTMGWPLRAGKRFREFGGSFIYPMGDDMVTIGLVVGLDYRDASLSVHDLLQELKTHPKIRKILEGGERVQWGAKTIPSGGFHSLPRRAARARAAPLRRRRRHGQRATRSRASTTRSSRDGSPPRRRSGRCSAARRRRVRSRPTTTRSATASSGRTSTRCGTCARSSSAASSSAARSRAR